jgi:hypothetical protein
MVQDKNGLFDIYGMWHEPFWQTSWFHGICYALIVCIVLLLGLIIGYYIYRKLYKNRLSAWQYACLQLEPLTKRQYQDREDAKQAYTIITSVLKEYCASRFSWPVISATDDEFATYVKTTSLLPELVEDIQHIVSGAVMVKFANQNALALQVITDANRALSVVRMTIPQDKKL